MVLALLEDPEEPSMNSERGLTSESESEYVGRNAFSISCILYTFDYNHTFSNMLGGAWL